MFRLYIRQPVHPGDGELLRNMQRRQSTIGAKVVTILGTPRVYDAAEEFIRGIVDIARERVVRAEVQSLGEAMHEIDRHRVIDAPACRREGRKASEETVHGIGRGVEFVEIQSRARGGRDHRGNIGWIEVRWQWCESASQSREARIKSRR